MQYSADGQSDGTATVQFPRPGFLASVFRDLGAEEDREPDGPATGRPGGATARGGPGDDPLVLPHHTRRPPRRPHVQPHRPPQPHP
ncbi:hypothetical protein, partial [Streptomyces sp. CBMA156]|uniref:hypothetical protein n=1 Tax=Streptomyces sp. CBMA156 TaxID=1930280 RepID=UPI001CB860C2